MLFVYTSFTNSGTVTNDPQRGIRALQGKLYLILTNVCRMQTLSCKFNHIPVQWDGIDFNRFINLSGPISE